ncbi:MAG TPA: 3-isopropylmalate dehydratase small subunit [Caulobacteraceae bacterium]|nr:3-isopropylmalate dehydratase small subunit [Caulobacteraceae bacterium]
MEPLIRLTGRVAPLLRANVDTDAIIPSREMKLVSKKGLSAGLFANWRYSDVDARVENPDFVLNRPERRGAAILLAGPNFGCGSSREHAVWALVEYGVRCILAPSFGAIFRGNCIRNGLLPIVRPQEEVEALAAEAEAMPQAQMTVDLERCMLTSPEGRSIPFDISAADREMLLEGLDAVGATLKRMDQIRAFEAAYRQARPWRFHLPTG